MFDIYIDNIFSSDRAAHIEYVDENGDSCDAKTISEAIEKYNKKYL